MNAAGHAQLRFQMQNILLFKSCEDIQQIVPISFFGKISVFLFYAEAR